MRRAGRREGRTSGPTATAAGSGPPSLRDRVVAVLGCHFLVAYLPLRVLRSSGDTLLRSGPLLIRSALKGLSEEGKFSHSNPVSDPAFVSPSVRWWAGRSLDAAVSSRLRRVARTGRGRVRSGAGRGAGGPGRAGGWRRTRVGSRAEALSDGPRTPAPTSDRQAPRRAQRPGRDSDCPPRLRPASIRLRSLGPPLDKRARPQSPRSTRAAAYRGGGATACSEDG